MTTESSSHRFPDVSVIIAAYNSMPYITRTLESLQNQTIGYERMEIIAVNDGSVDGTADELDRFATLVPSLHVVHQPNSGGAAAPRNRALDLARGRYIFILDADDYLGEEALERMVGVADEHRTDVVAGKMVGVGGRDVPQRMFRENRPRTDVHSSDAFWTVNPTKLFRRALIDRLGLRFDETMKLGEDQPFVASAYFNATGISLLADYDYVYWVHRDDGKNLTKTILDLESTFPSLDEMFAILAAHVEPGAARDRLAVRLFEFEAMNTTLARMPLQSDPDLVARGFEHVRSWLERYYTPGVAAQLPPYHRVCYHLIGQGDDDRALVLLGMSAEKRSAPLVARGDRAFVELPFFEEPAAHVPAEAYDYSDRVKLRCAIEELRWDEDGLVVLFSAGLALIDDCPLSASLILRHRDNGTELRVAASELELDPAHPLPKLAWIDPSAVRRFSARIAPSTVEDNDPLAPGRWDLLLEASRGPIVRSVRPGRVATAALAHVPGPALVGGRDGVSQVVTVYLTEQVGAITLHVRALGPSLAPYLEFEPLAADAAEPGALEVRGRITLHTFPALGLWMRLSDGAGREHRVEVAVDGGDPRSFSATLNPRTAGGGRRLADGSWRVALCLDTVPQDASCAPVPCAKSEPAKRWWSGWRRVVARARPDARGRLRIAVSSTTAARVAMRRLRRP